MAATEMRSIADACSKQLELLVKVNDTVQYNKADNWDSNELSVDEHLARFRMWAGNIGVFAEAHASLDHRLKDNEGAKQLMVNFLVTLRTFLQRAVESLKPNEMQVGNDQHFGYPNTAERSASSITSSSFHGTGTGPPSELLTDTTSPFERRLQGVESAIDRLYRLSRMIRRPSMAGQNFKAEKFPITDDEGNDIEDGFLDFALRPLEHQFPEATDVLKKRLAKGVVMRRKRISYRQNHQRKLESRTVVVQTLEQVGIDGPGSDQEAATTVRGVRTTAIDTSLAMGDGDVGKHGIVARSQTSASKVTMSPISMEQVMEDEESRQSTVFTDTVAKHTPTMIPDPPRPRKGSKEFECPYCCMPLPINRAKASAWRKHVLADLEPYVCIFEECPDEYIFFRDREAWISHMRKSHTTRWLCNSTVHSTCSFHIEQEFDAHMRATHVGTFTDAQLPLLRRRSKVPTTILFSQCPLCGWTTSDEELFKMANRRGSVLGLQAERDKILSDLVVKHLANHLEAISVKALPWDDTTGDDGGPRSAAADDETAQSEDDAGSVHPVISDSLLSPDHEQALTRSTSVLTFEDPDLREPPDGSYDEDWGFIPQRPYYGHDRDPALQVLLRSHYLDMSPSASVRGLTLPAFLVPIDKDKNFFARGYALDMIQQTLLPDPDLEVDSAKPPALPRCFAVHGPGGMGKTQIAAQFVGTHRHNFDAVLWAHAEDTSRLSQDFKDMAIRLGLVAKDSPDATDLAFTRDVLKRWLVNPVKVPQGVSKTETEKASWLLVFDGVVDGDDLNEFWPYDGPGSILITSRNPHSWTKSLPLMPFSVEEATNYLLHITGRDDIPQERSSAAAIAERLGGLPLALAQMGSIIVHKKISFRSFLSSYEEKEGQQMLLQWPSHEGRPQLSNYEHNVASVWAFDSLGKGAPLLEICSMLDPDGIPEYLFESTPDVDLDPDLVDLMQDYKDARNELLARSLVSGNRRDKKLFIHRLVQEVSRTRMSINELRYVFLTAAKVVASKWDFEEFTWRHGNKRWRRCEELFPHIQRLKDLFPDIAPSADHLEEFLFARLLVDAGWYRHERGQSADAILYNNMAQSICESLKLRFLEDSEYADTASTTLQQVSYTLAEINHNRGCIALEVNDPVSALRYHHLFNRMMIKELETRETHQDMRLAISWNELGNAYMLNQEWAQGEKNFLKSITEMKRLKGFKPTQISLPLANLGLAYWLQDKYDLASEALLTGLKDREAEFGVDDRISFITGRFLHGIGNVRESQGLVEESLNCHHRAVQHYRDTLGNRHHRTADVFVKVAEHHIRMKQQETALALLDHALEAYSISNEYKPERMRALYKRAKALQGLRRFEEADLELSKCFTLYKPIMKEKIRVMGQRAGQLKTRESDLVDLDVDSAVSFRSR